MWAPHPAALTTTASTLGGLERGDGRRARSARARSGSPACAWSAPQQPWVARDPHLDPLPRRGSGCVASLCGRNTASCTQPWRSPTRAAQRPARRDDLGQRAARAPPAAAAEGAPPRPRGSPGRAAGRRSPGRAAGARSAGRGAARPRPRAGARRARQEHVERGAPHQPSQRRPRPLRLELRAPRLDQVAVLDTPDGHALSHARQPRQSERCSAAASDEPDAAVGERLDEVDAPARGVRLLAELGVRRTAR